MTLYEIDKAIYELLENGFMVDEETGEVIGGVEELEQLQLERTEKLEGVALYIKGIESFIAGIKAEEEALAKRRKRKEDKVARLKKYLTDSIIGSGETAFESTKVSVTFRKSDAVIVDDFILEDKYWREKVTTKREPDKTLIKATIKSGLAVNGAYIEERQNIKIV